MARYEFGDRINFLSYAPPAAPAEGAPAPSAPAAPAAVRTDHRATARGFDEVTGRTTFAVPACDPATEVPLAAIVFVFVPIGRPLPATAAEFVALPDADFPKARLDLTPEQFGGEVALERPETLRARVPYLGQAIHVYND